MLQYILSHTRKCLFRGIFYCFLLVVCFVSGCLNENSSDVIDLVQIAPRSEYSQKLIPEISGSLWVYVHPLSFNYLPQDYGVYVYFLIAERSLPKLAQCLADGHTKTLRELSVFFEKDSNFYQNVSTNVMVALGEFVYGRNESEWSMLDERILLPVDREIICKAAVIDQNNESKRLLFHALDKPLKDIQGERYSVHVLSDTKRFPAHWRGVSSDFSKEPLLRSFHLFDTIVFENVRYGSVEGTERLYAYAEGVGLLGIYWPHPKRDLSEFELRLRQVPVVYRNNPNAGSVCVGHLAYYRIPGSNLVEFVDSSLFVQRKDGLQLQNMSRE